MEVEAARVFAEVSFTGDREEFSTFSLYRFASGAVKDEPVLRHHSGILAWMDGNSVDNGGVSTTPTASVRIIFMRRKPAGYSNQNWVFNTTEPIFRTLWSACRLDDSLQYLVWGQLYGLHHAAQPVNKSFYLHLSGSEMLVWSYDAETRATRVLCMGGEVHLYAWQLRQQPELIVHPACLPLLRLMRQTSAHLRRFRQDRMEIQDLEGSSGSVWWSSPDGPDMNPEQLGKRSREAGKFIERLVNTTLITTNFLDICSSLTERSWETIANNLPDPQRAEYTDCHAKILRGVSLMSSCLAVTQREVIMYQERAKILLTVNLHLINKADVDAAKRDSSSMKTVAVMTMAFLPATFFAALFAMPMFQWDGSTSSVVQPRFWIYWAFTVPCTLVVFVLWAAITQRQALMDLTYALVGWVSSKRNSKVTAA